jgi:hypothetical protein
VAKLDPIVIREVQQRQSQRARVLRVGDQAADALLWFAEYASKLATKGETINDVISKVSAPVVASATPNAKTAQEYIDRAAATFKDDILDRAIEMAYDDYKPLLELDK